MHKHQSMNITTDQAVRALWNKTIAERDAAKHALEQHKAAIFDPLYEELERTAPRPDLSFEIEALNGQIARYHVNPSDLDAWDSHWSPVFRRKAAAVRNAWLEHCRTRERLGMDVAGKESDRLCDAQCAIESTLIQMPAPDQSALLWKLEQLFGPEVRDVDEYSDGFCAEWINAVMDDARRLLGQNASRLLAWSAGEKMAA